MTLENIIQLMENPRLLNKDTLTELRHLMEEYPYFQTLRLLYVMNLNTLKDLSFYPELKIAAFYAGDRRKLFYHIIGDQFSDLRDDLLQGSDNLSVDKSFALIDQFLSGNSNEEQPSWSFGNYTSYSLQNPDEENRVDSPLQHQDIIDRFLEKDKKHPVRITIDPDVPVYKDSTLSVENSGPISGEESFFTETLANIYIKQRRFNKAIKIFKKLSLNNPEKSVYFANQIRLLEKMINNEKYI